MSHGFVNFWYPVDLAGVLFIDNGWHGNFCVLLNGACARVIYIRHVWPPHGARHDRKQVDGRVKPCNNSPRRPTVRARGDENWLRYLVRGTPQPLRTFIRRRVPGLYRYMPCIQAHDPVAIVS